MEVGTFVWADLAASVLLAAWVLVRRPDLGPRSLRGVAIVFVLGQVVAQIAVALVAPVEQLRHGVQLALVVVVLPALFAMVLSSLWVVRALADAIVDPRGGHPVGGSSRHASAAHAPSHSARGR